MEVFVTNIDSKTTQEQLHDALKTVLQRFRIEHYDVRRKTGTTIAHLTIADILRAQAFVTASKKNPSLTTLPPPNGQVTFLPSKNTANPQLVRVLQKEEKDLQGKRTAVQIGKKNRPNEQLGTNATSISFRSVECGQWALSGPKTRFVPFYKRSCDGHLVRKGRLLILEFDNTEIHIDIYNIQTCVISVLASTRTLTIHLVVAPRIYVKNQHEQFDAPLDILLRSVMASRTSNFRICALPDASPKVTGHCLTYRLTLLPNDSRDGLRRRVQQLTLYQVPAIRMQGTPIPTRLSHFDHEVEGLEELVRGMSWSFPIRFQIQALWANAALPLAQIRPLLPRLASFQLEFGDDKLLMVLRRLVTQLPYLSVDANQQNHSLETALAMMAQQEAFIVQDNIQSLVRKSERDEISIHRVLITPTGTYLYGPEEVAANRILRENRSNSDCFLRVVFADENEDRISFNKEFSNDKILYGRFLTTLRDGLKIAGEQFDFLGFSHSSLRSQSCWFMRPIRRSDGLLHARALITSLGDFSSIRCPAKCAARIGQAFSETHTAVSFDPHRVMKLQDVKVGRYLFTDGCGVMSLAAWNKLKGTTSTKKQPTLYQIRYKGAKGMLSLNTALQGMQIRLRDSMIKFTGSPSNDVEICGTNARALPFKLNRYMIKILEDLGIAGGVLMDLQTTAIQKLHNSATSTSSAVQFLSKNLSDSASGLPTLLKALKDIKIDATEDSFLRDLLGALLQVQLRDIKYKSRILVPDAVTLYGICDETQFLQEGEIFVTYNTDTEEYRWLRGQVAVTRSPALHPGDIQLANAVTPPDGSDLWNLTNCIVFSQKGSRDMPSMLSGGDLDGDLYNIIFDDRLIPAKAFPPAAYVPVEAVDIGRSVTSHDMTKFFVDFMQNDQLGRIATLHQVMADHLPEGTLSSTCLLLAQLHSNAVDFSKSGIPVDVKSIPRAPPYRPDFMAPSASTKIEKGITRIESDPELEEPQRYRYYESTRILGKLYRAVDEDAFSQELEDDASSIFSRDAEDNVLTEIWRYVKGELPDGRWKNWCDLGVMIREHYETNLSNIMSQYAVGRTEFLTEKEVIIGTILGRSGSGNKIQREQSDMLKTRFNRDLKDLKTWMKEQIHEYGGDLVDLAAACLYIAVNKPSNVTSSKVGVDLKSFGWFAAGMCVPELVQQEDAPDISRWNVGVAV